MTTPHKTMASIRDAEAEKYQADDSRVKIGPANSFKAGFDCRDKLDNEALKLAVEALEWYTKNCEVCFFELIGGDGAPSGYIPYSGNWDLANKTLAEIRKLRGE